MISTDLFGIPGLTIGGAGIWVGLFGLSGKWLVQRVAMRRAENDSDASLRGDLMGRIGKLENEVIDERRSCDAKLASMQGKLDAMQEKLDGIMRQLIQYQVTTGQAMPLSARSPEIEHALDKLRNMP